MKVTRITPDAAGSGGNEYFVGEVQVQPLINPGDGLDIVVVRFSAGARTYLHSHDVVQVLLARCQAITNTTCRTNKSFAMA